MSLNHWQLCRYLGIPENVRTHPNTESKVSTYGLLTWKYWTPNTTTNIYLHRLLEGLWNIFVPKGVAENLYTFFWIKIADTWDSLPKYCQKIFGKSMKRFVVISSSNSHFLLYFYSFWYSPKPRQKLCCFHIKFDFSSPWEFKMKNVFSPQTQELSCIHSEL